MHLVLTFVDCLPVVHTEGSSGHFQACWCPMSNLPDNISEPTPTSKLLMRLAESCDFIGRFGERGIWLELFKTTPLPRGVRRY